MFEEIIAKAEEIKERVVKFRREIHKNPELGGCEEETAAFVAGVLEDNEIEVKRNIGGYGVVGLLRGADDGDTIALRADMDALPIQDGKDADYASEVRGVMHACGHDVHTAILMGSAIVLGSMRDELKGNVKFIFQPSEETSTGGAKDMIGDGALNDPSPSAVFALHCFPEMAVGTIGHRSGMMTAAADRIRIVVKGRSGHASRPHQTVDAVLVSSMVISAIHHIVSRRTDPLQPAVISIGTIRGGSAENIIADYVEMEGTVRTLNSEMREEMPDLIENVVRGVTLSVGAEYEFEYECVNPPVINDSGLDNLVKRCAVDVVGDKGVVELPEPMMGAEDFAIFMEKIPGALFRLGTGNEEKGIVSSLHNPHFDVDEDSIIIGTKVMSWIAASYLNKNR